ncbi:hypothetical protein BpHYR1_054557 [Brachionus plicatilis]|uniref:Uncharacterized protein n=1 Tax=Brachionus plicatilis TaxID=10195 RepID=A0A3M7SEV8_BRAPC|nr:hypothetical protein BpHYR1_054557 [Brachionus plicatilis]
MDSPKNSKHQSLIEFSYKSENVGIVDSVLNDFLRNVNMLRNQEDHDHSFINSSKQLRKENKDRIIVVFTTDTYLFIYLLCM